MPRSKRRAPANRAAALRWSPAKCATWRSAARGRRSEIKTLIGDSVDKVDGGGKLVDEAGQTMQLIVTSVKQVADIMSEITAASQEQSMGIEQVSAAIVQMDEMTVQNAALVEQAAAAAHSMQDEAQVLSRAVAVFTLDAAPAARPRRRSAGRGAGAGAGAARGANRRRSRRKPKASAAADVRLGRVLGSRARPRPA